MSELICYADTETRSEISLKAHGTAAYAEHPSTRIQLFAYSFGDSDTADIWDRESGEPTPKDLKDAFRDPEVIFTYHNAFFDRTLIEQTLKIKLPIQRYRCSMAQALSHALPGSLDKLGEVLGLPEDQKKLKDGRRLVLKFCQPRKQKDGSLKWCTPETDPEDWAKYKEYCRTDVLAMKAIIKRMPKWNYPQQNELELWYMDQELNDHGMFIDTELVDSAIRAVNTEQASLARKTKTMTRDEVGSSTQRDALKKFIEQEYGEPLENMRKATLEALVEDPATPAPLRELLQVRLDTSTSSTAKYKKIFQAVSKDGYLRGGILYCGASRTGRDGSKVYNCLNLPKPSLPVLYNPHGLDKHIVQHQNILAGIEALKGDYAELVGLDIMPLCSSALRYLITAPKGKKLVIADLKAIEARVTPYIAEEEWKVQFFRDFDAGKIKYDNYVAAYAKSFNIPPDQVTKEQRQIGKIQELALGFGGAAGSLVSFCEMYNIDIPEMAKSIQQNVPGNISMEADSFFEWMIDQEKEAAKKQAEEAGIKWDGSFEHTRTYGLDKEVFAALDSVKRLWRAGHPKTAQCWKDADTAMRIAIQVPDMLIPFGKCKLIRKGKWVRVILPSGRSLCYPGAKINKKGDIVFMGTHQKTKQWCEIRTTGAKIFQNCFTADTKVLTSTGVKSIISVIQGDNVWDGNQWVETDGCSLSGVQEVGSWLGVRVTSKHQIFDGTSWRSVAQLEEEHTRSALKWALDSAASLSAYQEYQKTGLPSVSAIVGQGIRSLIGLCVKAKLFVAGTVHWPLPPKKGVSTVIFSLPNNIRHGLTAIQGYIVDVITKPAKHTKTTADEELKCTQSGLPIDAPFSNISSRFRDGTQQVWTWTVGITKGVTNRETYAWLAESKTPAIKERIGMLTITEAGLPIRNLLRNICRIGPARTLSTSILKTVNHSNGLWKSTMKDEKVYDLLNCGPNNRFTVVTDYGPVVVHNCVQATARDFFKYGQMKARDAGYQPVLVVYDELVTEAPDTDEYTAHGLEQLMSMNPPWGEDLPIAADGFEDYRYHKSLD